MALIDGILADSTSAGGVPRRKVDGTPRRKVYRMIVDGYDSRSTDGSSVWQLDVLAWEPEGARRAFAQWARTGLVSPAGAVVAARCTHAMPCFLGHHTRRMAYPEWTIRSMVQRQTGRLRRPYVWLSKTPVTVVAAAGWRAPYLVNGNQGEPRQVWGLGAWT